jgi:hypothetical protein
LKFRVRVAGRCGNPLGETENAIPVRRRRCGRQEILGQNSVGETVFIPNGEP